ncbi:alanine--tRNA ligase [Basilea psittacipulmonis]|uniref:Alanine--tRNA ligase n=1 Tax=Basilea psittacipulmonis DSM 24701 TaxID=1072685 RepID=A0A077DF75_9BURK|nr:alanine--tRNA ligase [Basilea psittacipulmonis]AIL32766.1 alanyl-tRNA synthetase [Basilea psittacipulmonis DSM 24701]
MKLAEIRQKYLDFFNSKGHAVVPSSSLVPNNDPTLMFTNSGMVQFKDVFAGREKRDYKRATTAQRCVRAGGKHNDLENVGYTARHHTFFEMLGNFSFGDYFKRDAIHWAWELLTNVYQLPAEKLWVTVYAEDDEAFDIWNKEVGVPADRIVRIGDNKGKRYASDNFWMMGDTGPCGPCTEIFYDHGPDVWGGPPGSPEEDGDRYIEIWNLVFTQFEMHEDGSLTPLPKPCVDTGMGLERIAAVLQHVHSNYEIDLFQNLIKAASRETGCTDLSNNSLKVIADHIRACSFLIVDGVIPGNEGRGYVLRRIIRRALRHGHKLGQTKPFFHRLVEDLVAEMGEAYPELTRSKDRVVQVLKQEEERFGETLEKGMKILEAALVQLKSGQTLDGQTIFTLYDTYGFPFDLTADICREQGFGVDQAGFDKAMAKQREMARANSKFKATQKLNYEGDLTQFEGYEETKTESQILAIYVDGTLVKEAVEGAEAVVVLDKTPFYAESGGQVGDTGLLKGYGSEFAVSDTQKIQPDVFGHYGVVTLGKISVGDKMTAAINIEERLSSMRNHSATHLMHKALRLVLGDHVQQKGSLVDAEKTRFDFSHDSAMTAEQIREVERIVNHEILMNVDTHVRHMAYDEAIEEGVTALFGEKYGDQVRVLDIGFSKELCGGTHVKRTGDIGVFKIVSESGIASGVRRVEAVTGAGALAWIAGLQDTIEDVAGSLKCKSAEIVSKAKSTQEQIKSLEKECATLKDKLSAVASKQILSQVQKLAGTPVLVAQVSDIDPKSLRNMIPDLVAQVGGVVVLTLVADGKVNVAAGVDSSLHSKLKAGEVVNHVCGQLGGKGGGKPEAAMGAGSDVAALPAVLEALPNWLEEKLNHA